MKKTISKSFKKTSFVKILAAAFILSSFFIFNSGVALASLTAVSVVSGSQTPNPVAPGALTTFTANITNGNGSTGRAVSITSISGLPTGATLSSSQCLVIPGDGNTHSLTFTINTTTSTPIGSNSFSITATRWENTTANCSGSVADTRSSSGSGNGTLVVNKTNQTITVTTHAPASAIYNSNFSVAATASSGLTVAITVTGGCSISSGTVTMTSGTTNCIVHYNQVGNNTYNAAPEITETVTAQKKSLTANVTANSKVYDGTNAAAISNCSLTGVVSGDTVTCSVGSATFADKNIGTGKIITATGITLGGGTAGNYQLSSTSATTSANITTKVLTVTATGVNKVYDGNTTAAVTLLDNRVAGDVLTINYGSASFDNKNVGTGKTVSVSGITVTGTDAGNYTFNTTASTTANITAKPITVTADAKSKVIGSTDPLLTYTVVPALLDGDTITGALTRVAGEAAGVYAITRGTLSAGGNYIITYIGANLTIEGITIRDQGATDSTDTSITIGWTTDHPTTSRVLYDTVSHSILGTAPNYGYNNSTDEDGTLAVNHSVLISGLVSGTTYYFRVISHGSPEVVSNEIAVTTGITIPSVIGNLILNPDLQNGTGSTPDNWHVGGYSTTYTADYPVTGPGGLSDKAVKITVTATAGGDAKWIFDNVSVDQGALYTFTDWYSSSTTTAIVAAFAPIGSADPTLFNTLATLPSTDADWKSTVQQFTIPVGYSLVAVYHTIGNVGTLSTDHYSLVLSATTAENLFPQGMVSLNFDDGWSSQLDNALPIIKNAGLNGTFYIISQPMLDATSATGDNLISSAAHPELITTTNSSGITWSNIFTDPTNNKYRFTDSYTSTGTSTVKVSYLVGGTPTTVTLGTLPASPSSAATFTYTFTLPGSPTVTPISISHSVTGTDTMAVFISSLTGYDEYMNQSQVLAIQAAGNEIGDHTVNHCNLVTGLCPDAVVQNSPDPLTADQEIGNARSTLRSIGISLVETLAYPYGAYNDSIESLLTSNSIVAGRSIDDGYNTKLSDKQALKVKIVDSSTTLAQVKNWIDTAVANQWWLILVFHQVENGSSSQPAITPAMLQSIVDYLNSQNVNVKTLSQAAVLMGTGSSTTPSVPTASPIAGTYSTAQDITLTSNGTSIRYTIDGSIPTCSVGTVYSIPVNITASANLQAVGCNGVVGSAVASFIYTIKLNQTITFGTLIDKTYGDTDFDVSATASSGLPVSFIASGNCNMADTDTVHITGAGSCTVTAQQAGNGFYNPAPDIPQAFAIAKATPIINWSNPSDITYGTDLSATQLNSTTDVGGTLTYTPDTGTILSAGVGQTLHVDFTPTDSTDYNTANKDVTINVNKAVASVTPNAQSKIYGDSDPTLGGILTGFLPADGVVATYSRTAGEDVVDSPYTISAILSPTEVLSNYNITYNTANFTITAKSIVVTAESGQSKVYGATDPIFAYTSDPLVGSDSFSGALSRETGEDVGNYNYTIGALTAGPNYILNLAPGTFAITAKAITVTADSDQTKVYGKSDPALTYTASESVSFTGALDRVAGENIGSYVIGQGTLSAGLNYSINFVSADFTITVKYITVTAVTDTKTYEGNTSSSGVPTISPALAGGDTPSFTQSFDTADAGIGKTLIPTGSVNDGNGGNNYNITFVNDTNGVINAADQTITFETILDKTYGDADFIVNATSSSGLTVSFSSLTPSVCTVSDSTVHIVAVGTCTIHASQVGNGNYNLAADVDQSFEIRQAALTVTPDNKTKIYNTVFSAFTGTVSGVQYEDNITATYDSNGAADAATVGAYDINATLVDPDTKLSNYIVTLKKGILTVSEATLTITADNASKTYGNTMIFDGTEFTVAGLANGDSVDSITLASTGAVSTATVTGSPYTIVPSAAAGTGIDNYVIDYVNGVLTVNAKSVTGSVTVNSKTYDSTTTTSITSRDLTGVVGADDVSLIGGTADFDTKDVGTGKTVIATGLSLSGDDAGNYILSSDTAATTADIMPKDLVVSAIGIDKIYDGTTDAKVDFQTDAISGDTVTVNGTASFEDSNVGSGKAVHVTGISIGGIDATNYNLVNTTVDTSANILLRPITITADNKTKSFGGPEPELTYTITSGSLVDSGDITGSLTRDAGEDLGAYDITQGTLAVTTNYELTFITGSLTIEDTAAPVFGLTPDIIEEALTPAGNNVSFTVIATDDVDESVIPTCVPPSESLFAIGKTLVNCTVTDSHGNTSNASFNIVVEDTTKPVTKLNGDSVINLLISDSYTDAGATALDNIDGDITSKIVVGGDTVNTSVPGVYHISYDVSDNAGNAADEVVRTVTVSDINAPVINPISDITVEATGPDGVIVTYDSITATDDADGTISATCLPESGSTFLLGATSVTCSATDSSGNIGYGTGLTITVIDTTVPTIDAHDNVTAEATSAAGAIVNYEPPLSHDTVGGDLAAECVPDSGSTIPLGDTTVTCTKTDAHGNTAVPITFVITVQDTSAPIITLLGTDPVSIEVGSAYTDAGATALDNYDGDVTSNIATVNPVNKDVVGDYIVTYNVTDSHGNASVEVTRTVHVTTDATPPVTTLNGDTAMTLAFGSSFTDPGATATDNIDGDITAKIVVSGDTVNTSIAGTYTIKYDVSDAAGNPAIQKIRTVIVEASIPVITNETAASTTTNSITVTWTTDHSATSRVIYDTVSHSTLGSAPNYGYANSTTEDSTLVTNHSVVVGGLSSGTTYYLRTVSHGSPETVSNEVSKTTSAVSSGGGGGAYYAPTKKPGDINGDGKIDLVDFNLLMVHWGSIISGDIADLNTDGKVDILEFNLLMVNWGK